MYIKTHTVLAIALCILVSNCEGQSHDLVQGQISYGSVILYRVNEYKYGWPFIVRTSNVIYPETGVQNFAVIRAIHVKDNDHDGTGGFPAIVAGGIGHKFANIRLKSQRGDGFNFTITIYGQY